MLKKLTVVASLLLVSAPLVEAGDKLESGWKQGEGVPAFQVRDVTGPNKGKSLCYV